MRLDIGTTRFRLGIDLGARSLGWQVVLLEDESPASIGACGVHTFDAGVDGDIEGGRDESRSAARRQARQTRRQFWRRQRRRLKVLRLLQSGGLLPPGDISTPEAIHEYLLKLDGDLSAKWCNSESTDAERVMLPYRLRAAALDKPLSPHELGRALYHLAQRRGFKSGRKSQTEEDEKEVGIVKQNIGDLYAEMKAAEARTLGEYFAGLNPRTMRVRRRHTHRDMFRAEFRQILDKQCETNATLTPEFRKTLHKAMFYQRPLKNQSDLIGKCELVPGKRRAAIALRISQQFRLLQRVNDLGIELPSGTRALTPDERAKIIDWLKAEGDLKFTEIRKRLTLRGTTFNLERGGEEKLPGNRTDKKLRKVFGSRFDSMTDPERDAVVEDLLTFEDETALKRRGERHWKLDDEAATELAGTILESDRSRHSREALEMLVKRMKDGTPYMTARKVLFPESLTSKTVTDKLPPVRNLLTDLRNPAVERALTELRKVVNAIIGRYGKPETIHIELARDLRNPRKRREEMAKKMRVREKEREHAIDRIIDETKIADPRRADVERVLLADECGWHCPYTGRPICMESLLGSNPQFDVEHIIPLSRSLDDSFANKTLCYHEENRSHKRNRTPFEAYASSAERWKDIIQRVKKFNGPSAEGKLRKFLMDETQFDEIYQDFTERQLNDTRYASKLAAEYLGCLYGGQVDADGRRRVQVSAGGVTAFLRSEWRLNEILGLQGEKNRQDHRHHAVDALAIALADPKTVKMLADAAERPELTGRRRFAKIPLPWEGFLEEVRQKIDGIVVSRRENNRIRGQLHLDTNYGQPRGDASGLGRVPIEHHVRKPVTTMTNDSRVAAIVDDAVRRAVERKLAEVGGDPAKLESDPPVLITRDGRQIPIRRVRVKETVTVETVGKGGAARYVKPGTNHHVAIVAVRGKRGTTKWEARPVTLLEAYRRRDAAGKPPIVLRDYGPDCEFVMALSPGDAVIIKSDCGSDLLCYVTSVSEKQCELRLHNDARKAADVKAAGKAGGRLQLTITQLQQANTRKIRVSRLGEVLPAND